MLGTLHLMGSFLLYNYDVSIMLLLLRRRNTRSILEERKRKENTPEDALNHLRQLFLDGRHRETSLGTSRPAPLPPAYSSAFSVSLRSLCYSYPIGWMIFSHLRREYTSCHHFTVQYLSHVLVVYFFSADCTPR